MKVQVVAALLVAMLATAVVAQTTSRPGSDTPRTNNNAPTQEARGPWYGSTFTRSLVYTMAGERVGELRDFAFDENGRMRALIVSVGGFLGIGDKEIWVSIDRARRMIHSDGKTYFTVTATKDELQALPAYKR